MKHLINYANSKFRDVQTKNARTGTDVGTFDRVTCYTPNDIDKSFRGQNEHILKQPKGDGYWLWKPYFIHRALSELSAGDYLFYCDSGAYFTQSIDPLIGLSRDLNQDLMVFDLQQQEKHWTKRDAFVLLDCDTPEYTESNQRLASFSLWRKSDFTEHFIDQYLTAAQDERLITDLENQCGLTNYDGFINHRHDQSIFSLLSKKHSIECFRDPSQWGNAFKDIYPNSPYESLIEHTRNQRVPPLKKISNFFKGRK